MNKIRERLEQNLDLLGTEMEDEVVGCELRELEADILEDPGALAPMLQPVRWRKRRGADGGRGIVPM